ncbi:hypothetical protein FRC02_001385 [Tulasnella sp. 418]|nr:hypothetical protein FRC02_001385 [Tulasnella sp. 418]
MANQVQPTSAADTRVSAVVMNRQRLDADLLAVFAATLPRISLLVRRTCFLKGCELGSIPILILAVHDRNSMYRID